MHSHQRYTHQKKAHNSLGSIILYIAVLAACAAVIFLVWRKPSSKSDNYGADIIVDEPVSEALAESEESVPEPEQTPEETTLPVETEEEETLQTESVSSDMDTVPESSGTIAEAEEYTVSGHICKESSGDQKYSCALSVPLYNGSYIWRIYLEDVNPTILSNYIGEAVTITGMCYYDEAASRHVMVEPSLSVPTDGSFQSWSKSDWKKAYSAKLDDLSLQAHLSSYSCYSLYDIQKDGVPELFVQLDDSFIAVYGISDSGQLVFIDPLVGRYIAVCGTNSPTCFLYDHSIYFYQDVAKVYLVNGRFKEVYVYGGPYVAAGDENHTMVGRCDLVEVPWTPIDDRSGLNWTSDSGKENITLLIDQIKSREYGIFTGETYMRENHKESKALTDAMADCWYGGCKYTYVGTTDDLFDWENSMANINCHSFDVYFVDNKLYLFVPYGENADYPPVVFYMDNDGNLSIFWHI